MSTNIFNRDDGNKYLSYQQIDKDFDNYWENEARNPVRNRIRIGRQYQATIQPLLKPSDVDKRKLEDRETLKWSPQNELNEQQLEQYLQLAKAVSMFSKVVKNENHSLATSSGALSLSESAGNSSQSENADSAATQDDDKNSDKNDELNSNQTTNQETLDKMKLILKGLAQFVSAHQPVQADSKCKPLKRTSLVRHPSTDPAVATDHESTDQPADQSDKTTDDELNKLNILPRNSDWTDSTANDSRPTGARQAASHSEDKTKKCNELRKPDYRSNSDGQLKQCSAHLNDIILDFIKANAPTDCTARETNKRTSPTVNQNSEQKDGDATASLSGGAGSGNSKSPKNANLRTTTSRSSAKQQQSSSTGTSADDKKEANEKKNSKFKSSEKRASVRSATKHGQANSSFVSSPTANKAPAQPKSDPIDQYEFDDKQDAADCSSLGSLKFYKDGQLVLKLNAKQPMSNNHKCQWEESADSIELNKFRRSYKKKKTDSSKSKEPLESGKAKATGEDHDDSSFESDDSRSSSSSSLAKALTMSNLFKKAKVKVENNYYVPLPSPSLSQKDDLESSDLESTNRKSISPMTNDDDLKRKLRTPKNGSAKKKILKLNECTNKLNISPNLLQQLNSSLCSLNQPAKQTQHQSSNALLDQLNLLSSLPIDLRQKLISSSGNSPAKSTMNGLNGLASLSDVLNGQNVQNQLDLSTLNSLANNHASVNPQQTNHDNLNRLLASFVQLPPNANTFLENIDSIKMQNQMQSLVSNLSALIEAEQLK